MEPCAGFAERFIRRASEKSKGWDSLEVDEGFATVARAKSPPDSILDRKVHEADMTVGYSYMHTTTVLARGCDHVVAAGLPSSYVAIALIWHHHMHVGISCEGQAGDPSFAVRSRVKRVGRCDALAIVDPLGKRSGRSSTAAKGHDLWRARWHRCAKESLDGHQAIDHTFCQEGGVRRSIDDIAEPHFGLVPEPIRIGWIIDWHSSVGLSEWTALTGDPCCLSNPSDVGCIASRCRRCCPGDLSRDPSIRGADEGGDDLRGGLGVAMVGLDIKAQIIWSRGPYGAGHRHGKVDRLVERKLLDLR